MKCDKIYIAIDLKSFYASVECKERNRDPAHNPIWLWRIRAVHKRRYVLQYHRH